MATPAAISALAALQSCSSGDAVITNASSDSSAGPAFARSSARRTVSTLDNAAVATSAVNDFAVDLYNRLAANPAVANPNLVFSPASIVLALAMTRAGAKGSTATEMDTVLHVSDPTALAHSMNALSGAFDSRTRRIDRPQSEPVDITLAIANSLWGQTGLGFEPEFLDVLATEYGAGLQLVDYKSDPESARALINAWVDDITKQRIPELIPQGQITSDSRLTLVNAIYMKAPWLNTFIKDATAPAPVITIGGAAVSAQLMNLHHDLNYAVGPGWQACELPYIGDELSMVIVLPDAEGGASLGEAVAAVSSVSGLAVTREVTLSLPKFDIETAVGLADVLTAMGMATAFSDQADFTGMTNEAKLAIGAVIHQANITVDEEGTEAAAATAAVMMATSAPEPQVPVVLVVDRPFVFAIRDNPTGALLFVGHIGDPTATRT